MQRRTFLAETGVFSSVLFAGCFNTASTGRHLEGYVRPDDEPAQVPDDLTCDRGELKRHRQPFDEEGVSWGADDNGHFALRVNKLQYERGETVHITLINTDIQHQETGNQYQYNFQIKTDRGWRDVRGWENGRAQPYTDELVSHEPDKGFGWEFEFTEDGLLRNHMYEDDLIVCPNLQAGRYRFAFWHDGALAVAFDFLG